MAKRANERYTIVESSEHRCCHNASVVDNDTLWHGEPETVCECYDLETAKKIAKALNQAELQTAVAKLQNITTIVR